MTVVLGALIVGAALAAILLPFVRRQAEDACGHANETDLAAELTRARDAKRSALEDLLALEADYRTGALAEADYAELKRHDETRALALIARVDALELSRAAASAPAGDVAVASASAEDVPSGRAPRWALAAGAALLLAAGIGGGYLVSTRGGADPVAQAATGGGQTGMPGPVMAMVREYRARLEADPRDVAALVGLGRLNMQRNDVTQAIEYFKRALDVDRGNPEALTGLGMILAEAGSFDEALSAFDRALAREPGQVEALWWKGQVQLYALKDYGAAVGTLERVVTLVPEGPDRARVRQALTEARAAAAATPAPR